MWSKIKALLLWFSSQVWRYGWIKYRNLGRISIFFIDMLLHLSCSPTTSIGCSRNNIYRPTNLPLCVSSSWSPTGELMSSFPEISRCGLNSMSGEEETNRLHTATVRRSVRESFIIPENKTKYRGWHYTDSTRVKTGRTEGASHLVSSLHC